MSAKVEVDEELLQYLSETAITHGVLIQTLLHVQEERQPGFSAAILQELDTLLGKRSPEAPEPGWVRVRARLQADLQAAIDAVQAKSK